MVPGFEKTPKQREAVETLIRQRHGMLYGGSRSGKSLIIVRSIFLRAMMQQSKHLMVRFRFNHARTSLGHETVPFVLARCFPDNDITYDGTDHFWRVPTVDGEESQVWLGGTDSKDRIEKVLGNEYSTVYANECSQIPFEAIPLLWTRLAETSGLEQRFWYDCNPTGKKHWTHLMFMDGQLPDGERHDLDVGHLRMNPEDNLANLSPEYIKALESLPRRQRQRFLKGLYLTDVEGALWTDRMLNVAKVKDPAPLRKTVIAVDPAVTNNPGSDECGIVVCSLDENEEGVVHGDLSLKASTRTWANRVVSAHHAFEANYVVAEVNQGGDLVEDAIHNIDPNVKVKKVRAAKGKFARAEPVSMLYEPGQEKVSHTCAMPELEAELTETVFDDNLKASPNRLDALVWGLTDLMIGKSGVQINVGGIS